jgi:hypothetical protein
VNSFDAARWMTLQARVASSQEDLVLAREQLIERLGDHLCGGLGGPLTRTELKVLARARRNAASAKAELAEFLTRATMSILVRSTSTLQQPASSSDNDPASRS